MSSPHHVDTAPYGEPPDRRAAARHAGSGGARGRELDRGDDWVRRLRFRFIALAAAIVILGVVTVACSVLRPEWAVRLSIVVTVVAVAGLVVFLALATREVRDAHALASRAQREADQAVAAHAQCGILGETVGPQDGQLTSRPGAPAPAEQLFADSATSRLTKGSGNGVPGRGADSTFGTARGLVADFPGRAQVFAKHARRLQVLLNNCLGRLDKLEKQYEDPDLLAGLFEVDHGVVQARRQAANLAILSGELPQRRSATAVKLYPVLRAVLQEIQRYTQAVILPTPKVSLNGAGVVEVIHLLAELLDNATRVSNPEGDPVTIGSRVLPSGALCIKIADNGLGLPHEDIDRVNRILEGSDPQEAELLLNEHRTGLVVVAELARRNGITVALEKNVYEGVTAAVILPPTMLVLDEPRAEAAAARRSRDTSAPLPAASTATATATSAAAALPAASSSQQRWEQPARQHRVPVPVTTTPAAPRLGAPAPVEDTTSVAAPPQPAQPAARRAGADAAGGSFGRRGEGTGQHHRVGGEEPGGPPQDLPRLPVRPTARPGAEEPADDDRPPLPVRSRTASRMPEQLRTPPSGPAIVPGHNGELLAGYQEVREQRTAKHPSPEYSAPTDTPPTTQRTDTAWPTT